MMCSMLDLDPRAIPKGMVSRTQKAETVIFVQFGVGGTGCGDGGGGGGGIGV